jgi:DNA-binding MarR family transcriptional regulator
MHVLSHPGRGAARDPDLQRASGADRAEDLAILGAGLSELLATDRTTLTRNLRPLLASGLVERAQSGDKRRHELVATAAGRALFKRALPLWAQAEEEVRTAMGAKLTADLHGALERSMEKLAPL